MTEPLGETAETLEALRAIVGPANVLTADIDRYQTDWRQRYRGRALAVVRPADTAKVAAVVRLCAETRTSIVPQGGNTGLCGGATPDASGRQIILSLTRMHRVRAVDRAGNVLIADAGCVLADLQRVAAEVGRLLPLSLAAEGSCSIGGNVSTNAGGIQVLRYGNTRDLVLGLEVVLPNGEVWDGLRTLRKDNTGYDLKQLFIGSEGTLGVVTAVALKLVPLPRQRVAALVSVPTNDAAVELLAHFNDFGGERLTAFELLPRRAVELVCRHFPDLHPPISTPHEQAVLLEISDSDNASDSAATLQKTLEAALERGLVLDAVLANSEAQRRRLWALRENLAEAQQREGPSIKHDVSLPLGCIGEFIAKMGLELGALIPQAPILAFGHVGDGNLHYNVLKPPAMDEAAFEAATNAINRAVHDRVHRMNGSVSAEHGVGQYRRAEVARYKQPLELEMMRAIKRTLDPGLLMNPGKVL